MPTDMSHKTQHHDHAPQTQAHSEHGAHVDHTGH